MCTIKPSDVVNIICVQLTYSDVVFIICVQIKPSDVVNIMSTINAFY